MQAKPVLPVRKSAAKKPTAKADATADDVDGSSLPTSAAVPTVTPAEQVPGPLSTTEKSKYIRRKFVWLPARSLLLMQDEARFNWSHGIAPRKHDKVDGVLIPRQRRISLTLRQVSDSLCVCVDSLTSD